MNEPSNFTLFCLIVAVLTFLTAAYLAVEWRKKAALRATQAQQRRDLTWQCRDECHASELRAVEIRATALVAATLRCHGVAVEYDEIREAA